MAYYNICPNCGANLDPGEPCDCEDADKKREEFYLKHMKENPGTGQFVLQFGGKDMGYAEKTVS